MLFNRAVDQLKGQKAVLSQFGEIERQTNLQYSGQGPILLLQSVL